MKITFNAKITPAIIDNMLKEQDEKKKKIIAFCEQNKESIHYKDSELEFEYEYKSKVETRPKTVNKIETRKVNGTDK